MRFSNPYCFRLKIRCCKKFPNSQKYARQSYFLVEKRIHNHCLPSWTSCIRALKNLALFYQRNFFLCQSYKSVEIVSKNYTILRQKSSEYQLVSQNAIGFLASTTRLQNHRVPKKTELCYFVSIDLSFSVQHEMRQIILGQPNAL